MKALLVVCGLLAVTVDSTLQIQQQEARELRTTTEQYAWSSNKCKSTKSGSSNTMSIANTQTKCKNYAKCGYTGTCATKSTQYKWLTTSNSNLSSGSGCYKGVNYKDSFTKATTE